MKFVPAGLIARTLFAAALVCGLARAEKPATVPVLELTPENAQIALAVPPFDQTLSQAAAIAKLFAPDPAVIDGFIAELVAGAAQETDAWGAENFKEIATKYGVNGDAPVGLFADATDTVNKAAEEYAANKAAAEKAAAEKAAAASEAPAEGAPAAKEKLEIESPELTVPNLAGVLTVADKALVQQTIDGLVADVTDGSPAKDETVGSVTVKVHGPYAYFFAGDKVVLGSAGLVKGIAARVDKPAKISYGSAECPAASDTEIVALVHGKRFFPLFEKALPAFRIDDELRPAIEEAVKQAAGIFSSDEPLVVSLGVGSQGADLQARIDGAANPGIKAYAGEAKPLRLAKWLPENTLAMISWRFNEVDKKRLIDSVLPAIAAARGEGANQVQIAKQVVEQIGDEITIGLAAADQDFPSLFAMVSLAKPDETKMLLQMLVPAMPGEKHGEVDIQSLAVPIPVQFSIAYPGDMILLSNSVDGMKKIIDLQKSNGSTKFLASLNPPLDPEVPRYSAIMINSKLISDVLLPISSLGVPMPKEQLEVAQKLAPLLQDVRLVNEVNGNWHVNKLSVRLQQDAKTASAK